MVLAAVLRGGSAEDERGAARAPSPEATATPPGRDGREPGAEATPKPDTRVREGDGELAIGITEPNPAFIRPEGVPEPFERWRRRVQRMSPDLYRLVVDWAYLDGDLARGTGGCMRDIQPCAPYAGLVGQLDALAAAQRGGGWETLVVITGTPERYAARPGGCERAGTEPRSRAPDAAGLRAYRRLIRRVQAAADRSGARLRYWSPWNEPNHPYGLSPQRTACSASAPSAAIRPYVRLARAMRDELRGGQELVIGELAGLLRLQPSYTRISEFLRGLPADVVCAAPVVGQHGYVGGPDPVDVVARTLARFDCPQTHEIWITETGVGAPRRGETRGEDGARACRNIRRRLNRWYDDPRVTAAVQYTVREDDRFPTGLVTVDLARAYPSLAEWVAWGARESPTAPPPRSTC